MTIPTEVFKMIECCINSDGHYVKDAILLTCGANACKRCINELNRKEFKCYNCNKMHKIDENARQYQNPAIDILIEKIYTKDLVQQIRLGFNDALRKLESLNFDEQINKNVECIEFEIDIKIESLKHQLDQVGDVLRQKLNEMKSRINMKTYDRIQNMKQYIINTQRSFSINQDGFREYQQKLYECKNEIENFARNVPQIIFETSELEIEEGVAGKLIEKYPFTYDSIKLSKNITIPTAKFMTSMTYSVIDNQILITDNEENKMKIVDLKGRYIKTHEPLDLKSNKPSVMCTNYNGDLIYVADANRKKIVIYKKHNFEYLTQFGDHNLKKPDSMIIDHDTNLLYVTDFDNNYISIWNCKTNKYCSQFKIDSPAQIQIVDDKIFVISENDYEHVKTTGRIRVTKGSNCIFIINKFTNQVENKIKLDEWFDPCGLYVDKNQNILTTAFELDHDKFISQKRSLFIFNRNLKLVKKLPLDIEYFTDMLLVDRKIYFCSYNSLKIVEFD